MFEVRSSKLKSDSLLESNCEPRTSNALELSSVGRVGDLSFEYERRDGRTVLARSRSTSPWHHFPPIDLDETGSAYTLLVNPSGGLVGGDRLTINANLGEGAHVIISTPSANRVYRSLGEPAIQTVELSLGPGAILEWVPDVTIPFAGSRFRQVLHATLAPGATILLWDAVASGRVARGERWQFTSFENEIRMITASGASVLERYRLTPQAGPHPVGFAGDWDYVASLFVIGDAVNAEAWKRLEESLATILHERHSQVLGGVSEPGAPGLAVKLVARSAPDLSATMDALWGSVRRHLWSLPAAVLRRY